MAKLQVVPDGNRWKVIRGLQTVSKHNKKQRAKEKARRLAVTGDQLTIRRSNGQIQDVITVL